MQQSILSRRQTPCRNCAATAEKAVYLNIEPKVALLSFSNFGSTQHPMTEKVRRAAKIIKKKAPNLTLYGEMADTAVSPDIANELYPVSSAIKGDANATLQVCLASPPPGGEGGHRDAVVALEHDPMAASNCPPPLPPSPPAQTGTSPDARRHRNRLLLDAAAAIALLGGPGAGLPLRPQLTPRPGLQSSGIEEVTHAAHVAPESAGRTSLRLAVTKPPDFENWDDMGALLRTLGPGYQYTQISLGRPLGLRSAQQVRRCFRGLFAGAEDVG